MNNPLSVFKAKAPVCVCIGDARYSCGEPDEIWCGPQKTAFKARRKLDAAGFVFPSGMAVALSHARLGEGREEFDALMVGVS